MMRSDDLLPVELINDILLRLPRKSFTRFRAVCKSWQSIIISPQFMSSYYRFTVTGRVSFFLLWRGRGSTFVLLQDDGDEITVNSEIKFPEIGSYRLIGTCNGLICGRCLSTDSIILWNPFIEKHIMLPAPTIEYADFISALGLFTASDDHDFKVLRIPGRNLRSDKINSVVEVYSINSGVWQRIQLKHDLPAYELLDWKCMPLFTKDAVHWIAAGRIERYILAYHVHNEATYRIELPGNLAIKDHFTKFARYYLSVLGGEWLTVIEVQIDGPCNIWVMKEYGVKDSWTKLYSIELANDRWISHVAWFRNNAQVLFFSCGSLLDYSELISYDLNTKEMEKVRISVPGVESSIYNYKASLMLL